MMATFNLNPLIVTLCDYWYYNIVSPLRDNDTPELSKDEFNALFDKTKLVSQFMKSMPSPDIETYCDEPDFTLECKFDEAFNSLPAEKRAIPAEDVLRIHNKDVSPEDKIDIYFKFIAVFAPAFSKIKEAKKAYNNRGLKPSYELSDFLIPAPQGVAFLFTGADYVFGNVLADPNYPMITRPKAGLPNVANPAPDGIPETKDDVTVEDDSRSRNKRKL
ncbi:MAG: hypothetical protein JSR17_09945 [Proteobacteria bacterium]|nr:hypothetical protein [Pseudomonadota bacterium]